MFQIEREFRIIELISSLDNLDKWGQIHRSIYFDFDFVSIFCRNFTTFPNWNDIFNNLFIQSIVLALNFDDYLFDFLFIFFRLFEKQSSQWRHTQKKIIINRLLLLMSAYSLFYRLKSEHNTIRIDGSWRIQIECNLVYVFYWTHASKNIFIILVNDCMSRIKGELTVKP